MLQFSNNLQLNKEHVTVYIVITNLRGLEAINVGYPKINNWKLQDLLGDAIKK